MSAVKRILASSLCILLIFLSEPPKAYAASNPAPPSVTARYALIQNQETGRILYDKAAKIPTPMASTTKMMTAIVVTETCILSDKTTVSREASQIQGSTMHLAQGEEISVRALLYGLLLCSGNDAAIALAQHASGSVEAFCKKMNDKAALLGLSDTHFTSPHGLDDTNHYTTAYDLAQIARAFMEIPLLADICATKTITIEGHTLTNTNPLLGINPYVSGIKTGYTDGAGYCLVLNVKKADASYIIVLLNCPSSKERKEDAQKLTEFVTQHYALYGILPKGHIAATLPVRKGETETVDAVLPKRVQLVLTQWERENIKFIFTPAQAPLTAPVSGGSTLGDFQIYAGNTCVYQGSAVAFKPVDSKGFWGILLEIVTAWIYLFS